MRAARCSVMGQGALLFALLVAACNVEGIDPLVRQCPGPDFVVNGLGDTFTAGLTYPLAISACEIYPRPIGATWIVADTTVAQVTATSDSTAMLNARKSGETSLELITVSPPGRTIAAIRVTP